MALQHRIAKVQSCHLMLCIAAFLQQSGNAAAKLQTAERVCIIIIDQLSVGRKHRNGIQLFREADPGAFHQCFIQKHQRMGGCIVITQSQLRDPQLVPVQKQSANRGADGL